MSDLPQAPALSSAPYLWSLVLSFGALLFSIILLYIARFSARLESTTWVLSVRFLISF